MANAFVLVHGERAYYQAGESCIRSLLIYSDMKITVAECGEHELNIPDCRRIRRVRIPPPENSTRAARFLLKFNALSACLMEISDDSILIIDADAQLAKPLTGAEVDQLLSSYRLAMCEQKTIRGSTMSRADFLSHYKNYTHRFLGPNDPLPELSTFRFFNSGVVFGKLTELLRLTSWALELIAKNGPHQLGEHMIADQDYFQFWVNNRHPGSCCELSWHWNHCEHWDDYFPRSEARILHFSNFCNGPEESGILRMSQQLDAAEISVIIVLYNSSKAINRCLEELFDAGIKAKNIIAVDNASTDNGAKIVEDYGVEVIKSPKNLGFGKAANLGARSAKTAYLCFLNPDCSVNPGLFDEAKELFRSAPEGVFAPTLRQYDSESLPGVQFGYSRLKLMTDLLETNFGFRAITKFLRSLNLLGDKSWQWPIGACFFISTGLFRYVNGFDEEYFMYMEDVELGLKLTTHGSIFRTMNSQVIHDGQQGSNVTPEHRLNLLNSARLLFAKKHYGRAYNALLALLMRYKSPT